MKKSILILILAVLPLAATAQRHKADTLVFADEYLDTVQVHKKFLTNDYFLLGVDYGVTMANFTYNPTLGDGKALFVPNYFSLMFTHYEKLFDRYDNFAFRMGVAYAHEGFTFAKDPETDLYLNDVDSATKAVIELLEVPVLAGFHVDFAPVKFQGEVGVYGGYRKSIQREGPYLPEEFTNAFKEYEYRIDYGLRGGAGFALMFDPIEIHFNALIRWGWQSLYEPDYRSEYYYRFAYPLDITFTAGIHFQLTKRSGKTSRMLRKEAKDMVYGTTEDTSR